MQVVVGVVKRNALATAVGTAALALLVAGGLYWSLHRPARDASAPSSGALAYQIQQLTSTGDAVTPAISPDGKYVAYSRAAGSGFGHGLWVRRVFDGERRRRNRDPKTESPSSRRRRSRPTAHTWIT